MRKGLIPGALLILSFLLGAFFSPGFAQDFPRHKNPAEIKEEAFFPLQLVAFYGEVVRLQLEGRWDEASSELAKSLLSYVPEPVRHIFARFNELIQQVTDKLKIIREDIDSAEHLLCQGEIEKAGETLKASWETLLKAERDLDNLNAAVDELRRRIGALADRVREKIEPLHKLKEDYKHKIQSLYRKVQEGKRLEATFLEISVDERSVLPGGSFEVYGKLKREAGGVLGGREVDIFLENEKLVSLSTDEDGQFKKRIDFPFLYKKNVSLFASFSPKGEDKEAFYPSTSKQVLLEPFFYTPQITARYQKPVYPVLPFTLQGEIRLEDAPLANYPVRLQVAEKITELSTDEEGRFETELSLPADGGKSFPVTIFTPARGIISPASFTINIPVSYKLPFMVVNVPRVVVAPFPLKLQGEVFLENGSMKNAMLRVMTEEESVTTTVEEKSFQVRLPFSLLHFSGWERVTIFLHPQEAWVLPLSEERKVLVINPLTLSPFIGLLFLFVGVASRRKKEVKRKEELLEERKKIPPERKVAEERKLIGLALIYSEAVDVVASLTGIRQAPADTIREYLNVVKDRLGEKGRYFELISRETEKFLYASEKPPGEEKAKQALEKLREQKR